MLNCFYGPCPQHACDLKFAHFTNKRSFPHGNMKNFAITNGFIDENLPAEPTQKLLIWTEYFGRQDIAEEVTSGFAWWLKT